MDRLVGEVLSRILARSHLLRPGFTAMIISEEARPLGVRDATVYLADLEQDTLRSMPRLDGRIMPELRIDSTVAGRSYQALEIQYGPADEDGLFHVWLPLMDGSERLGVLELVVEDTDEETLNWCRALASLAGLMVVSKAHYSDVHARVRRSQRMALQAEMVWAFMAPPTFATDEVLVACGIRPMYGVGGDAYDYSLLGDHLDVMVLDAVGHDLASGLIASVALASCRNTRRGGGNLADMVAYADHAIASQFGRSRFATALLCDLDVETGLFSWVPCGHPPPLLIRENKVVKELFHRPRLPLGLVSDGDCPIFDESPPVYTEQLQPRDRLLLYTDGVVEARAADGSLFGVRRLSDFVIRHSAAGIPAPETLRRLNRAVIDFQHGRLGDDATTVLVQWRPEDLRPKFEF